MDKQKYCPMVKEVCKENVCMAWNNDECSFFAFFKRPTDKKPEVIYPEVYPGPDYISGPRERILKEEEQVQQILPECVEWAQSKKITRPTREEIRAFLIVKNLNLSETGMRSLWRLAKAKLRESKHEQAQILSQKWRENGSNVGLGWSPDEDDALLKGFDSGQSPLDLSKIHKRTIRAIELRLVKFGKIQFPK